MATGSTSTGYSDTTQQVRNLGSAYTTFQWAGKPIAYLEQVSDSGQKPVAPHQFIHPLGEPHPTDIVTARALDGGTIGLAVRELWHQEIWELLAGLEGTHTITDVFARLASTPDYVTCSKIIIPPDGRPYGKVYHRCTVVDIDDSDSFQIASLSVSKTLTIAYTHTTAL